MDALYQNTAVDAVHDQAECELEYDRPYGGETAEVPVLELFRQWLDASREADRLLDADETEYNAAVGLMATLEEQIIATPGGAVALAIKTYFLLKNEHSNWAPQDATLRYPEIFAEEGGTWSADIVVSILRDAAAQVPVLAELAAPIIHEDASLIDADIEITWCRNRLADPERRLNWESQEECEEREARDRADKAARLNRLLARVGRTEAMTPRGKAIKVIHCGAASTEQQKAELWAFAEELAGEYGKPLPDGDAGLVEAERRLREIRRQDKKLYNGFERITVEIEEEIIFGIVDPVRDRLREFVEQTRPAGLAGAAAKLRLLTDPEIGIIIGEPSEGDIACIKQVAEFVETVATQN